MEVAGWVLGRWRRPTEPPFTCSPAAEGPRFLSGTGLQALVWPAVAGSSGQRTPPGGWAQGSWEGASEELPATHLVSPPPWGCGRWRPSQPAAGRPPARPAGPWGVTLRLAPWMGRGRGTGCAGHLSPLTRPPRRRPPGAGRQSCGLFPPLPPRKQVSRWWAAGAWAARPPLLTGETRLGASWLPFLC